MEKSKSFVYKNNKAKNWSEEKLTTKTEKLCSELVVEYSRDYIIIIIITYLVFSVLHFQESQTTC